MKSLTAKKHFIKLPPAKHLSLNWKRKLEGIEETVNSSLLSLPPVSCLRKNRQVTRHRTHSPAPLNNTSASPSLSWRGTFFNVEAKGVARLDAAPEITSSLFRDFPLGRSLGRDGRGITMTSRLTRDAWHPVRVEIFNRAGSLDYSPLLSIPSAFATLSRSFGWFSTEIMKFLYIYICMCVLVLGLVSFFDSFSSLERRNGKSYERGEEKIFLFRRFWKRVYISFGL